MSIITNVVKRVECLAGEGHFNEIIRGASLTFWLRLMSFLLLNLLTFLIAKVYGGTALGIYSLSFSILNIFLVVVLYGTDTALIRLVSEYLSKGMPELANQIFYKVVKFIVPVSFLMGISLFWLGAPIANGIFKEEQLGEPLKILALVLPFFVASRLYSAAFRAAKYVCASIFYEIVFIRLGHFLVLSGMAILLGRDFHHIIYSLALILILNAVLSSKNWNAKFRELSSKTLQPINHSCDQPGPVMPLRRILAISGPMYLTASMFLIMDWTDTIMLGIFKDAESVGIYNLVLKFSMLTSFSIESINTILVPKFAELFWGNKHSDLKKVITFSTRLAFWTSFPILILLAFFATDFLSLFGQQFAAGGSALVVLCLGQFIKSSTGSVIPLLNMTGHQIKARNILALSALANIVLNTILIPFYGMVGAAMATAISLTMRDLIATSYTQKIFGYRTWYFPILYKNSYMLSNER